MYTYIHIYMHRILCTTAEGGRGHQAETYYPRFKAWIMLFWGSNGYRFPAERHLGTCWRGNH